MKRNFRISIVLGIFTAILIAACATTKLTSAWKDPSYTGRPLKVMVVGVAKKPANKRIFEDEFVKQLSERGTQAVASYTVMTDKQQADQAIIDAKVKELKADAVLITRLVNKKSVRSYVPGRVYYPPSNYNNWRDYYGHSVQVVYAPGYTVEDEYALVETNIYNARNDKLIWSAESETEIHGSDQDLIKSYIGVMVDAMADEKLLK